LYLLAVAPPLLLGGGGAAGSGPALALAALHVVAAATLVALARGPAAERWLVLWIPLLALPFLYWEIPQLNQALAAGYHDPMIVGWECAVFGVEPARALAGALPYRWLSEPLHLAYLSLYPLIYVPPLLLLLRRERDASGTTLLGLALAAFPSSHGAIMTAQSILAVVFQRRVGVVVSVATAALAVGAVYGGFHYGADVLVGGCVGALAAWAALRLRPAEASTRVSRATAASDIAG
jgi:membrane-associated phospholipid phosphatase